MASPWTPELKAEVCKLWTDHSAISIAAQLQARGYNFTRSAVIGLVHRMGLSAENLERVAYRQKRDSEQREGPKRAYNRRANPSEIQLRCAEIAPRHISIIERSSGECCYPYGDGPFTFCGHPVCFIPLINTGELKQSSYCQAHHDLCVEPAREKVRA